MPKTICLALTGASGMPYGLRLLDCLLAAGCRVQLLYSQAAQVVARQEMDLELPSRPADARQALLARLPSAVNPENLQIYGREEWFAPVASGSNPPDAMVICPCSMGTLAAIAQGLADNLIERAADVVRNSARDQYVCSELTQPHRDIQRVPAAGRDRAANAYAVPAEDVVRHRAD